MAGVVGQERALAGDGDEHPDDAGEATTERIALVLGGLACIVGVLVAVACQRSFLSYDARHPTP